MIIFIDTPALPFTFLLRMKMKMFYTRYVWKVDAVCSFFFFFLKINPPLFTVILLFVCYNKLTSMSTLYRIDLSCVQPHFFFFKGSTGSMDVSKCMCVWCQQICRTVALLFLCGRGHGPELLTNTPVTHRFPYSISHRTSVHFDPEDILCLLSIWSRTAAQRSQQKRGKKADLGSSAVH